MAFDGKVVLITGGGSGMGRLAARKLAAGGSDVAIFDVNAAGLAETAAGFANIHTYSVDVTNYAAVVAAVQDVEHQLGPIDRVYNAAAIMPLGKLLDQDVEVIHKLMAINYGGLVNITKATLPAMVARGRGDFISFASLAGWIPMVYVGAYNATKFAALAFTEVLYHENRDSGVRFACVCPPPVATPLLDQGHATVWPKTFDKSTTIQPQEVLDTIESCLEKGEFWVFPGKGTRFATLLRRWLPGMLWKNIHQNEGC